MINKITAQLIPPRDQRYTTSGDWQYDESKGELLILVSRTPDWRDAIAVAIHEIVESVLCVNNRVSQLSVDSFDMAWEEKKMKGETVAYEPGLELDAPYHEEHMLAMTVELLVTNALGRKWDEHNLALDATEEEYNRGK